MPMSPSDHAAAIAFDAADAARAAQGEATSVAQILTDVLEIVPELAGNPRLALRRLALAAHVPITAEALTWTRRVLPIYEREGGRHVIETAHGDVGLELVGDLSVLPDPESRKLTVKPYGDHHLMFELGDEARSVPAATPTGDLIALVNEALSSWLPPGVAGLLQLQRRTATP